MAARERNGFTAWVQPSRSLLVSGASLRCPNCNSTHLKKVSLAYQEGLFYTDAHTRMYFVGFGSSGPDFMIGKATTRGLHQSALSKQLNPPVKWSYRKLIRWCVLLSLSIGWIVFYANTVRGNSLAVQSAPLTLTALFSAIIFIVLLLLIWKHNHSTYKRHYSKWDRSYLCQRCGALTEQV